MGSYRAIFSPPTNGGLAYSEMSYRYAQGDRVDWAHQTYTPQNGIWQTPANVENLKLKEIRVRAHVCSGQGITPAVDPYTAARAPVAIKYVYLGTFRLDPSPEPPTSSPGWVAFLLPIALVLWHWRTGRSSRLAASPYTT